MTDQLRSNPELTDQILNEASQEVEWRSLTDLRVKRILVSSYFSFVELDSGHVGAAMSYFTISDSVAQVLGRSLIALTRHDPLLRSAVLASNDRIPVKRCLKVALLSALNAVATEGGGGDAFRAHATNSPDWIGRARSAAVVGFGGYLETFARSPSIRSIDVFDLQYCNSRARSLMQRYARFLSSRSRCDVRVRPPDQTTQILRSCDTVAITGSALSNGTMGDLLRAISPGTFVVVQGQSAGIPPAALFRRGVTIVHTTIKTSRLMDAAESCDKLQLEAQLEGQLRDVYLLPR